MNRVLNFAVVAMSAIVMTSSRVDAAVVNITEGSTSGYTMTDGNTYVIQNSVSFSNSTAGGSGISIEDGATVVIYIPTNVTFTAIGANGSGQTGGGAGILVPETSTLIITGEGTVNATGGNAGNGGNGRDGEKGHMRTHHVTDGSSYQMWYSGNSGAGGLGGGGAGAGIGGSGGLGGYCGVCSSNGKDGENGGDGTSMGNVYILGSMKINACAGLSGVAGTCGNKVSTYSSGGGGGGGAGSSPTYSIGGGGSAGGGGGAGDAGDGQRNWQGGKGGGSATNVGQSAGEGPNGGVAGNEGGIGILYVSLTAMVNVERTMLPATTHSAAQYTVTLDANSGEFPSSVDPIVATLGCELPDCIPTPTRAYFLFDGWRTATGEEYYHASGMKSKSSYSIAGDVVLYAQWRSAVLPDSGFWLRDNSETGWFVDSGTGEEVVFRSGEIGNSTNSWMEATVVGPLPLSFDWKVSCNTRGHYLAWFIDGVEQARIRGEVDWTTVTATIPEGEHVVRFDYVKGSTAVAGEDKGQVRNFTMGLRVETDTMQVLWDWTTNYWVDCSIVGKGTTTYEAQWVAEGTNLVIPFSVNTPFYSLSLSGDAEGAVLGDGIITVPITAPRSIALNVTEYTYDAALDGGRQSWTSGGAANWIPQGEVSHDGQDAVKSGDVTGDDVSTLSTVVTGPGTLAWWWKLEMSDCAGVDVFVDGAFVESLDTVSDWVSASTDIVGDGEHTVRFEFWNAGTTASISDCAYIDQVSWTPEGGAVDYTVTTPEPVPYLYLDTECPMLLAQYGGDYEVAAKATAANGRNKVWECYVAGISPTNATSKFVAKIEMKDGAPVVTWEPDLNTNGVIRTYKVYGSETLENGGNWQYPTNSLHRFFKVTVEMP